MTSADTWQGSLVGWARKYLRTQVWRTMPLYEFDDLMQEAFFVWQRCAERYPSTESAAHFMALFKISLIRHVHNLASRRSRQLQGVAHETLDDAQILDRRALDDAGLYDRLDGAPEVILRILAHFRGRRPRFHCRYGLRETTNAFLSRLGDLPIDAGIDMVQMIRDWQEGEPLCRHQK